MLHEIVGFVGAEIGVAVVVRPQFGTRRAASKRTHDDNEKAAAKKF
jgi:hypothetical protein